MPAVEPEPEFFGFCYYSGGRDSSAIRFAALSTDYIFNLCKAANRNPEPPERLYVAYPPPPRAERNHKRLYTPSPPHHHSSHINSAPKLRRPTYSPECNPQHHNTSQNPTFSRNLPPNSKSRLAAQSTPRFPVQRQTVTNPIVSGGELALAPRRRSAVDPGGWFAMLASKRGGFRAAEPPHTGGWTRGREEETEGRSGYSLYVAFGYHG